MFLIGLFQRAISQSGNAHCPWTLTRPGEAKKKAETIGKLFNCPTDDSMAMINCLKTKDAIDIIGTDRKFQVIFQNLTILIIGLF